MRSTRGHWASPLSKAILIETTTRAVKSFIFEQKALRVHFNGLDELDGLDLTPMNRSELDELDELDALDGAPLFGVGKTINIEFSQHTVKQNTKLKNITAAHLPLELSLHKQGFFLQTTGQEPP